MERLYNIFIEGIPGSGKSTLQNALAQRLPEYRVYREGEISPVELAWCAYMTGPQFEEALDRFAPLAHMLRQSAAAEGEHWIVPYTKIRTDCPDFYPYMERFEIYSGRWEPEAFRSLVVRRYEAFDSSGNLFECSFFQNILEELMLYAQCSDEEIESFYRELIGKLDLRLFRLIRLLPEDIRACLEAVKSERVDEKGREIWFAMMLDFVCDSPYGRAHSITGFDGVIQHFERRIRLENRIMEMLPRECVIRLKSRQYDLDLLRQEMEAGR